MDDKVKALLERVKGTANYAADAGRPARWWTWPS